MCTHRLPARPRRVVGIPVGVALFEAAVVGVLLPSYAAAAPASKASAAKGPYLTSISETGTTIRVELDAPAAAAVDVAVDDASADGGGALAAHVESPRPSTMHVIAVSGLASSTRYAYTVRVGVAPIAKGHFVTGPPPGSNGPRSFLVYGDDRTDDEAHAAVVRAMSTVPSAFLVNTGDMVADGGSAESWATFFSIEAELLRDRPLFAAIGNHELYDDAAGANFARYFGFIDAADPSAARPYGTVRSGNVRIFFLNGMHGWDSGPEREWLERALSSADSESGLTWRFVVVHHGPWSSGPHGPNAKLVAARVPELLASHDVDLLFCGHDHIYERGDAGVLKYVVTGGGGAPLYRELHGSTTARKVEPAYHFVEVTTQDGRVEILARRVDGSVLDRCGFRKRGGWDCDAPRNPSAASPPGAPSAGSAELGPGAASASAASSDRGKSCACDAPGAPLGSFGAAGASAVGLAALATRRRRPPTRPARSKPSSPS